MNLCNVNISIKNKNIFMLKHFYMLLCIFMLLHMFILLHIFHAIAYFMLFHATNKEYSNCFVLTSSSNAGSYQLFCTLQC